MAGERPDGATLGALVGAVLAALPELKRLRLSSLDAVEVDDDLRTLIAGEPRLMPHLHLSLQAGDDLVLKRMKRRHSRADVVRFCDEMRSLRPDIVFGADLIAGFPTEDETMFSGTLGLIEECGPVLCPRLPVLTKARHAGCAHAAGRRRRDQGAGRPSARGGGGGACPPSCGPHRPAALGADRGEAIPAGPRISPWFASATASHPAGSCR
jgi:hypothetical protein